MRLPSDDILSTVRPFFEFYDSTLPKGCKEKEKSDCRKFSTARFYSYSVKFCRTHHSKSGIMPVPSVRTIPSFVPAAAQSVDTRPDTSPTAPTHPAVPDGKSAAQSNPEPPAASNRPANCPDASVVLHTCIPEFHAGRRTARGTGQAPACSALWGSTPN